MHVHVTAPCLRDQTLSSFSLLDEVIERSIDDPENYSHSAMGLHVRVPHGPVRAVASSGHVSDGLLSSIGR